MSQKMLGDLMRQAQKLQAEMAKMQEEAKKKTVEATAGGGMLVERWECRAALEAHLRSEAYRRILAAIELSGAPPEVRFDFVSSTEGMDLIERSREPGAKRTGR